MSKVILDEATLAKLINGPGPIAICDATGTVRGFFSTTPEKAIYADIDEPYTEQELDDLEAKQEEEFDLVDILAKLEGRP